METLIRSRLEDGLGGTEGGLKVWLSVCFGWIWWAAWAMMGVEMRWPGG